jgi:hypothetical protein
MNEWVGSTGGMVLTGENLNTQSNTCSSANLCNIYLTQTDLVLKPGLRGEMSATNRLDHDPATVVLKNILVPETCALLRIYAA